MSNTALRKAVIPVGADVDVFQLALVGAPTGRPPRVGERLVQQTVGEALESGLDEVIFVMRDGQVAVGDRPVQVPDDAGAPDQEGDAAGWAWRPRHILISRQSEHRGLGHAIWSARAMIGEEAFAVMLPRGQMQGVAAMSKMMARYRLQEGNVVGILDDGLLESAGTFAAITQAAVGRYILQPGIFTALENQDDRDLNAAVLAMAEAWPLYAVKLPRPAIGADPKVTHSDPQVASGSDRATGTDAPVAARNKS